MSQEFENLVQKADENIGEALEDAELQQGRIRNQRQKGLMISAIVVLIFINLITMVGRQSTEDQAERTYAIELFVIVDEMLRSQFLASGELPESIDNFGLEGLVHYRKLDATNYELTPLVVSPPYNLSVNLNLSEANVSAQLPAQFSLSE